MSASKTRVLSNYNEDAVQDSKLSKLYSIVPEEGESIVVPLSKVKSLLKKRLEDQPAVDENKHNFNAITVSLFFRLSDIAMVGDDFRVFLSARELENFPASLYSDYISHAPNTSELEKLYKKILHLAMTERWSSFKSRGGLMFRNPYTKNDEDLEKQYEKDLDDLTKDVERDVPSAFREDVLESLVSARRFLGNADAIRSVGRAVLNCISRKKEFSKCCRDLGAKYAKMLLRSRVTHIILLSDPVNKKVEVVELRGFEGQVRVTSWYLRVWNDEDGDYFSYSA